MKRTIKQVTLVFSPCFHEQVVDGRPNPRRRWPEPRTCPGCRRRRGICEVRTVRVARDQAAVS